MFEAVYRNIVFHFNKKHLEDSTIPMWVVKGGGKSYYVEHVSCDIPWSTKETPTNSHTKGSIKVDKVLLTIDDDNHAKMTTPTVKDIVRLTAEKTKEYARIVIMGKKDDIQDYMISHNIAHTQIKTVYSSCGSYEYSICDIKKKGDLTMLALAFNEKYRLLQPNEIYYKAYENEQILRGLDADYFESEDDEDILGD